CDGRANAEEQQEAPRQQARRRECHRQQRAHNHKRQSQRRARHCGRAFRPCKQPKTPLQPIQILCETFHGIHATSLPAGMVRLPTTASTTAITASSASTHHHSSAFCSCVPVPRAAWPLLAAIPVFFHNSTVSAGTIEKSDSRRS